MRNFRFDAKTQFLYLSSVDIAESLRSRFKSNNSVCVLEHTVLAQDMRSNQLDILGDICIRRSDLGRPNLNKNWKI